MGNCIEKHDINELSFDMYIKHVGENESGQHPIFSLELIYNLKKRVSCQVFDEKICDLQKKKSILMCRGNSHF